MDDNRFDRWSRQLAGENRLSRRFLGAGVVAALAGMALGANAETKKKRKKKKKKKNTAPIVGCPNGCSFNERCVGNQCVPGCIGGTTPCAVSCCLDGAETCQNEVCVPLCVDKRPPCGGLCCGAGISCINGSCGVPCPAGRVTCSGQCCAQGDTCDGLGRCGAPCGGGECPTYVLDTSWTMTGLIGSALDEPCGIDRDSSGNIYVLDCGNDRVVKLTSNGNYVTQWAAPGFGLSVDGNDTVYVANGGLVAKYATADGASKGFLSAQISSASDVSVAGNGDVFVLQNSSVTMFDRNGTSLGSFSPVQPATAFSFPSGIAADQEVDRVVVANTQKHLIQRLDLEGVLDNEFGGLSQCGGDGQPDCSDPLFNRQFRNPTGVAIDADGNMFIADFGNGRIVVLEEDSGYITQFGSGELVRPDSLTVDADGNVFVADAGGDKVVKYRPANAGERERRIVARRTERIGKSGNGKSRKRPARRKRSLRRHR